MADNIDRLFDIADRVEAAVADPEVFWPLVAETIRILFHLAGVPLHEVACDRARFIRSFQGAQHWPPQYPPLTDAAMSRLFAEFQRLVVH